MTEEQTPFEAFTSDATKRATLAAFLKDPVIVEAMDIADDVMRPRAGEATDGNQPLSISKFHQSAGAERFAHLLTMLTKAPIERKAPVVRSLAKTLDDLPKTPDQP